MDFEVIESIDDPRIAAYRELKDRELARHGERFIAGGEHLVRRLIASDFPVASVFLSERRVAELGPLVPEGVPVYVAADGLMHEVIGYTFHSGVIGCGRRKAAPTLEEVMGRAGGRAMLVICPEIANAENMGATIRISAAFGVDAMVLGERSCDPFWRQSVRVSMGAVFSLPIVRSRSILEDLHRLRERWGVELFATVLDGDAERLAGVKRRGRAALLFGNEAQGLGAEIVAACDRRVIVPMRLGTDSLNVAVSAGIFLYHFRDG